LCGHWIHGQSGPDTSVNTPVTDRNEVDDLRRTLDGLSLGKGRKIQPETRPQGGGAMNTEKQRLYRKASAKVLYTISI
jgi:hypothetical protein